MSEDPYFKEILSLPVAANMRHVQPTVSPYAPSSSVLDLVTRRNVGFLVVVEDGRPVGVVTEKDILQRIIRLGKDLELTPEGFWKR